MKSTHDVDFVRLAMSGFDKFPLALVRISADLSITQMNWAARSTAGLEFALRKLLLSDHARALESAYARRASPGPNSYLLSNGKYQLTVFPTAADDGSDNGALCIVIDRSVDQANLELMEAMSQAHDARDLLRSLEKTLHEMLAFDGFNVILVATDQSMLRSLYEGGDVFKNQAAARRRWWPTPTFFAQPP